MGLCVRSKGKKSVMNGSMTSIDSFVSPPLQQAQFCIALNSPGSNRATESMLHFRSLDRLFLKNGALRAVKGTQEKNESQIDLI
jgi:hypothetical protein